MAYKITIVPDKKLIVIVFEGTITIQEIRDADADVLAHPDFSQAFNGICDFRNAHKELSKDDLDTLSKRVEYKKGSNVRWCSLNITPKETGLAMMFSNHIQDIHAMEVFSTVDAASQYLNTDLSPFLAKDP